MVVKQVRDRTLEALWAAWQGMGPLQRVAQKLAEVEPQESEVRLVLAAADLMEVELRQAAVRLAAAEQLVREARQELGVVLEQARAAVEMEAPEGEKLAAVVLPPIPE